jgi:hypothetical protein
MRFNELFQFVIVTVELSLNSNNCLVDFFSFTYEMHLIYIKII